MAPSTEHRRRRLLIAVKLAIAGLVLWAVHRTVIGALEELRDYQWQFEPLWLVAAGLLYLVGLVPAALFWYAILRGLGQRPRVAETMWVYYLGHIGKYVPGKAFVVILRTGLIRSERVDTRLAAVSVFYETLGMMGVAALLSAVIVVCWFGAQLWLAGVSLAVAAAVLLPTLPSVLSRLLRFGWLKRFDAGTADAVAGLGTGRLLLGWLLLVPAWPVLGLSLWATLRSIGAPGLELGDLPLCTLSVALAIVAGFLAMMPGGAVVREAVLLELMVPQFGEVAALVSALLLRLVFLVSEIAISGILYGYAKWAGLNASPAGQSRGEGD